MAKKKIRPKASLAEQPGQMMRQRRVARPKTGRSQRQSIASPLETARLLDGCRCGDEAASRQLFDRYLVRLTALARTRISPKLATRFDADDVVMSAYRSFFVGLRNEALVVENSRDLWQILLQVTLRKLYRQVARHTAAKRNVRREQSAIPTDGIAMEALARDATPAEAVALADELQWIQAQLPPVARRIFELRLQGSEILEIATELGINERTVRRWLARVKRIVVGRDESRTGGEFTTRRLSPSRKSPKRLAVVFQFPSSLSRAKYENYVLQRMIGAGASGKVYRAVCQSDGKSYALKFLRKSFATDRAAIKRFLEETSLVAGLHHPNIMPILGAGRTPWGGYFFVMPLADSDLQEHVASRTPIKKAIAWIKQAAAAIEHIHDRGLVHCDLKPSNLLLSRGIVRVSDFGLAGRAEALKRGLRLAGTPAFMAPEQVSRQFGHISVRTDVYGLGATLYALLTGRPPFSGDRASDVLAQVISAKTPTILTDIRPEVPPEFSNACIRCLAKNPKGRFPSVAALLCALAVDQ